MKKIKSIIMYWFVCKKYGHHWRVCAIKPRVYGGHSDWVNSTIYKVCFNCSTLPF